VNYGLQAIDRELASLRGVQRVESGADRTNDSPHERAEAAAEARTLDACNAIRALRRNFSERDLCCLLSAISSNVDAASWRHMERGSDASDAITDLFSRMETAAEAIEREAA